MNQRPKVTILQHRLLHYRVGLFEKLHAACVRSGIDLHLVYGGPSLHEALKRDTGCITWAHEVRNRWTTVGDRDLLWQPMPRDLNDSDLVILMQENRILSNYPILLGRLLGRHTRIAYWGHGKNFQSDRPTGLRERWKAYWLNKVDWWFAYTGLTRNILIAGGFPPERITCLNNAIDNEQFITDLQRVDAATLEMLAKEIDLRSGAPLGLYCGSLYPDKRLDLMADVALRIHRAIPAFRLVVIGDGPRRGELEKRLAGCPWARCVGAKRGEAKAAYFKLATIILSPGAVGLHVLDAFCAGLPMITTANARHGPEIEYLEHGVNGLILGDDPESFARSVIELLKDPARSAMVTTAAKVAGQKYTLDNMTANFLAGIEACLGAKGIITAQRHP